MLAFDYGLPTANQIVGFTFELTDLEGFNGNFELNVNNRWRKFPNPNLEKHRVSSEGAIAWMGNLSKVSHPYFGFGEAFYIAPDCRTSFRTVQESGIVDYASRLKLYEFVDDNDDQDRFPDLRRNGFLPGDDPRVINTIERIQKELRSGDYLYRYKATDGIEGEEGAFVLCGFWMAEALALAGRLDEALAVFATHTNTANHVGLIAEEIDPSTGALLGNFPQAFSHLGLIQAAARLDLALRQRDEGVETAPLHAADSRRRRTR